MTDTVKLFVALLALLAQAFVIVTALALILAPKVAAARSARNYILEVTGPLAMPLGILVAAVTISGSLFFSEYADYLPCHLCWLQRTCLYPQVVLMILLVWKPTPSVLRIIAGALFVGGLVTVLALGQPLFFTGADTKRSGLAFLLCIQLVWLAFLTWRPSLTWLRRISILLLAVDVPISIYHYLVEWYPNLETNVCNLKNPCSLVYVREFHFQSLPLMAMTCALTLLTLLFISSKAAGTPAAAQISDS